MDGMVGEAIPRTGRGTEADSEAGVSQPLPWSEAQQRLSQGGWFWLATVRPDGAPHVMPVFSVWSQAALFVASKETARKSRNLAAEPRCVITHDAGDLHLVVEGVARKVADDATLTRASEAFGATYGWPTVPQDGKLDAEYGAPTSGGPPYDVFEIVPTKVIGLPTGQGGEFTPTRWRFQA